MYRIRLASGEEAVYRTAEELALGVSSGVISAGAEVFHKAAGRWLPIDRHPDYRAVVTGKRPAMAHPTSAAEPSLSIPADRIAALPPHTLPSQPRVLAVSASRAAGAEQVVEEYDHTKDPAPVMNGGPTPFDGSPSPGQKLRLLLALAMGLAGLGLVGGSVYAAWRYLLPLLEQPQPAPQRTEGMSPEPAPAAPDSTIPTVYRASRPPLALTPEHAPPENRAVVVRTSRFQATQNRTPGYTEAYADARAEMAEAFDYIHFQRVFAPTRFAAPESLRATRRMVSAAANIVRVYRGREVMMEQTYRPGNPAGRGSFREPFETAEAARALLTDTDSLLGLLVAQQGRMVYDGKSVTFNDPHAGAAYASLREKMLAGLGAWTDSIESPDLVTIPRILRALGSPPPPPRR